MNRKNPKHTQNFITSKKDIKKILNHTNISKDDNIIEIGSGKGHFTREIAKVSQSLTAVEIDERLCRMTQEAVEPFGNVTVTPGDILKFSFPQKMNYKIFGNIPFNISTDIVRKITFESSAKFSYLIVEEGFAKRLKNLQRSLGLQLMVEMNIKILTKVPRTHFHPQPKVDSVLIMLERHEPLISKKDYQKYQSFVYKWINKKYNDLFTKNQFRQALKYAKVMDHNDLSKEQFISIFNSYKLFN